MRGLDFCYWHAPELARERAEARSKGGRARHGRKVAVPGGNEPVTINNVADVVALLERVINDALALENSLGRARAIGSLAGVLIKALEFSTLEERIEALERQVFGGEHDKLKR